MNEGQLYTTIHYDIDHDGAEEVVALSAYKIEGGSYLGQLVVTDLNNQLIFEGPRPDSIQDACAFGHFDYGDADIEAIVEDIDDDGSDVVSLIGALPVSDLRPTPFRVWRWRAEGFTPEFVNTLVEAPADSNYYVWQERDYEYTTDRWISKFWYDDDGELIGRIIDTTGEDRVLVGEAKLVVTENGFGVCDWVKLPQ